MRLHCDIGFNVATGAGNLHPSVTITDRISGCVILEAELTMEAYAEGVLTARHSVPCVVDLNDSGVIGQKVERKQEAVWVPSGDFKDRNKTAAKALKPFEKDGWRGSVTDATNHHRWIRKPPPEGEKEGSGFWYNVTFHRYVPATDAEREAAGKR